MNPMLCPLCTSEADWFFTDEKTQARHFHCGRCDLRFLDPSQRLVPGEEIERYRLHKNDVGAVDYQKFVSPLVDWIKDLWPPGSAGLDFGCGTAPILAHMLSQTGREMRTYDVFFAPDRAALEQEYDFVGASEVAEHFYQPAEEFRRLKMLLKPGGHLALMTLLVPENVNYESWHYRRDPTHVVFYSVKTFAWIREQFGFSSVEIRGDRCVLLSC